MTYDLPRRLGQVGTYPRNSSRKAHYHEKDCRTHLKPRLGSHQL
jgi:hypothetical protein